MKTVPDMTSSKLVTTVVSTFTAHYIYNWPKFFPDTPLEPPHLPTFDGRAVTYPSTRNLRDYMSWRQVDCAFFILTLCFHFDPSLLNPLSRDPR